jgi:hypothetical protein
MNETDFELVLGAAESFVRRHPDQVGGVRAAAAKAIRDLTDITNRRYDANCETFADWLWTLETETGDVANGLGSDSVDDSRAAANRGDYAAAHGFVLIGAWFRSFRSTFETIGMERTAQSARCHDLLCRIFAGHELMMTQEPGGPDTG